MPYETKRTREARKWITLAEAVTHVANVEGSPEDAARSALDTRIFGYELQPDTSLLSFQDALNQIRGALEDGEIPIHWKQGCWPEEHAYFPGSLFAMDAPPSGGIFWRTAAIDPSRNYAVLDAPLTMSNVEGVEYVDISSMFVPSANSDRARYRVLLLSKSKIIELWPNRTSVTSAKVRICSSKPSPPADEELLKVVRELYETTDVPPNLVKAEQLVRVKLPTAKREQIIRILKLNEFAQKRRPAGNQRKPR